MSSVMFIFSSVLLSLVWGALVMRVLGDILCYDIIIMMMIIKTVSGFPCYKQYLFSFYFKGTKWRESSGLQSTD